jgi:hypothetical protein
MKFKINLLKCRDRIYGNDKAFLYDSRPIHSSLFPLSFMFWNGPESGVTQAIEHSLYSSLFVA